MKLKAAIEKTDEQHKKAVEAYKDIIAAQVDKINLMQVCLELIAIDEVQYPSNAAAETLCNVGLWSKNGR
jgi:hypothetical protein